MKTKKSLQASAKACLNRAAKNTAMLDTLMKQHKAGAKEVYPAGGDRMSRMRGLIVSITKDFHEYNAYNNVLTTD